MQRGLYRRLTANRIILTILLAYTNSTRCSHPFVPSSSHVFLRHSEDPQLNLSSHASVADIHFSLTNRRRKEAGTTTRASVLQENREPRSRRDETLAGSARPVSDRVLLGWFDREEATRRFDREQIEGNASSLDLILRSSDLSFLGG